MNIARWRSLWYAITILWLLRTREVMSHYSRPWVYAMESEELYLRYFLHIKNQAVT